MSTQVYTQTILDPHTGEIIPTKWIKKTVKNTEMFVRTYIEDIGCLSGCSGSEKTLVLAILKYVEYDTNKIYLDSERRKEICETWDMKMNTLNTAVSRLGKKNILIKYSSSGYILNPQLFFFGSDIAREKVFQLNIQYTIDPS